MKQPQLLSLVKVFGRYRSFAKIAAVLMLGATLLIALTGCDPLTASEESIKMQAITDGEENSDLPVINDVYDKSVESDAYSPSLLNLP